MSQILSVEITQEHINTAEAMRDQDNVALCDYCVMTQAMKPLFDTKINTGMCNAYVVLEDDVEEIVAFLLADAAQVVHDFDNLYLRTQLKPQTVTIRLSNRAVQYLSELGKIKMMEVA